MATPHFRACTVQHNGRAVKIVTKIGISQAFDPATPPPLPFPIYDVDALWDTGATGSVVTKATASALGLPTVGTAKVFHAGGADIANRYMVNFFLPNNVQIVGLLVSDCSDIAGGWGAIIGMDVIGMGDFSITHQDNKTCMSFRIPSIQRIDYVAEAERIKWAGVGRNDPCPCGSGKKFKKCHGS